MWAVVGRPHPQSRTVSSDFKVVPGLSTKSVSRAALTDELWRDRPCVGDKRFISDDPRVQAAAARVCWAECPIRKRCADFALQRREPAGVWGGMTVNERERVGGWIKFCAVCGARIPEGGPVHRKYCGERCRATGAAESERRRVERRRRERERQRGLAS